MDQGDELLVIDQTEEHEPGTQGRLEQLAASRRIRWFRQQQPSITKAMNRALLEAGREVVLFVDDDIRPEPSLVAAHRTAHASRVKTLVAGRVIQPWDGDGRSSMATVTGFARTDPCVVAEFMGGNFSIRRKDALEIGGFDENFVQVAYRFEAEFAFRFRHAGGLIVFEPSAALYHLHEQRGGTRAYGEHLTTAKPAHAVGAYYCSLRTQSGLERLRVYLTRPVRAVATKHHLRRPWWIPATLAAELRGMVWATLLYLSGPKLIGPTLQPGGSPWHVSVT
jgi:glycosyltransferase involved in cell wall biosynthesis